MSILSKFKSHLKIHFKVTNTPVAVTIKTDGNVCVQITTLVLRCNTEYNYDWKSSGCWCVIVSLCEHLDSPVRRDVAEGCCCCEGTRGERKGRGRRGRKETGRGRRHGGRRVTGWGPWLEDWSRTRVVLERETGNLDRRLEVKLDGVEFVILKQNLTIAYRFISNAE